MFHVICYPLAELNQCVLNPAYGFVVNVIDVFLAFAKEFRSKVTKNNRKRLINKEKLSVNKEKSDFSRRKSHFYY